MIAAPDAIRIGDRVQLKFLDNNKTATFTLSTARDDLTNGYLAASSPLGQRLLGLSEEDEVNVLQARPEVDAIKIAAIGYCYGGTMALELARSGALVSGVVGFHSGLATAAPQDARNIKGKVLVCIGADDPSIPSDQRSAFEQEMREGRADWQMNIYGGVVHSFTNPEADQRGQPERARHDAKADARSWAEMCAFFEEIFRLPTDARATWMT